MGLANSITDDDSVAIQYSNAETGKSSNVNLNCDQGAAIF